MRPSTLHDGFNGGRHLLDPWGGAAPVKSTWSARATSLRSSPSSLSRCLAQMRWDGSQSCSSVSLPRLHDGPAVREEAITNVKFYVLNGSSCTVVARHVLASSFWARSRGGGGPNTSKRAQVPPRFGVHDDFLCGLGAISRDPFTPTCPLFSRLPATPPPPPTRTLHGVHDDLLPRSPPVGP